MAVAELIETLHTSTAEVEAGKKREDFCCTLTGYSLKETGIRPHLLTQHADGRKVWQLNYKQAKKLLKRCEEAMGQ